MSRAEKTKVVRPGNGPRALAGSLLLLALSASRAVAQVTPLPYDEGPVGLGLALRHLPVEGGVLYVTAHPDDENNGVLVALNRGRGLKTALLTVTRGDGGQNEIGPELFQAIGILRSEELAAVHRYDGAEQYFTRAYEFGYSFSVEETFEKWGKEEILRDVVRIVRLVRPDVILTLPREAPGGGQHHQASARLAHEAFRAAADPSRFPEQIRSGLRPWQARKVYQAVGGPFGEERTPNPKAVVVRTSEFDPLLGMSWHQLGMLARAAHRCQGTGQLRASPGAGQGAYELVDSEPAVAGKETDILEGVDTSLLRLMGFVKGYESEASFLEPGLKAIEAEAKRAQEAYDARAPHKTLGALAAGLTAVRTLRGQVRASGLSGDGREELLWRLDRKEWDFLRALGLAQGVAFMVTVDDGDVIPGQTFGVAARVWNQGPEPMAVEEVSLAVPEGWSVQRASGEPQGLGPGEGLEAKFSVTVSEKARYSQPYWKRKEKVDRYEIEVPAHAGLPWSPPDVVGRLSYTAAGVSGTLEQPAHWRYEGRWVGSEKQKVVNVVPPLSVSVTPEVAVVPASAAKARREFRVTVLNNAKDASEATVRLEVPSGWTVEPKEAPVRLRYEGEEITTRFFLTPPAGVKEGEHDVKAVATAGGREYREGYQVIAYDHIQERHLFHPATSRVKTIDVKVRPGVLVGYVMGAGDEVPPAIEQVGAKIEYLTADDIAYGNLSKYPTIVTGIRAYQTRKDLKAYHHRLMKYVEGGGHLVVQYNKLPEFNQLAEDTSPAEGFSLGRLRDATSPFAPYAAAITSNRVSVEEAPVTILAPAHPVFTGPNRISAKDFEGWVQERGLYFFGAKDPRYTELLSSTDPWPKNPGEKKGMLVEAKVGKGTWTYVGIGLWRQLPAGTPGAYRLLANLVSRPRGGEARAVSR